MRVNKHKYAAENKDISVEEAVLDRSCKECNACYRKRERNRERERCDKQTIINKENEDAYKKLFNLLSLNSKKIKYVEIAIKELKRDEWNIKLFQEIPKIVKKNAFK